MDPRFSPRLEWANKDKLLLSDGAAGYRWVDPHAQPTTLPGLEPLGIIGVDAPDVPENLLVAGDALEAIDALSADRALKACLSDGIRLVYVDPPFNTGHAFVHYDDALDSAMWLSMLRDRLAALVPFLAPTASVWVHLDDAEVHHARCVLDEVFGRDAFVATIVWQKRNTRESRSAFSNNHDYIHVYAPAGAQEWKRSRNLLPKDAAALRNRDGDPRGPWADAPFTAPGFRANQHYDIVNPSGMVLRPPKGRSWYATEPVYKDLVADNRIWFPKGGAGLPRLKLFPEQLKGLVPFSLWGPNECGTNDEAKRQLMAMFPDVDAFDTPKPESLLERIVHIGSDPGDLVVDIFAGSGTTPAVAHKTGRRWIAVERSIETIASFTLPRLTKVVAGADPGGVTELVGWDGGGSFAVGCVESEGQAAMLRLRDEVASQAQLHATVAPRDETLRYGGDAAGEALNLFTELEVDADCIAESSDVA